MHQSPYSKTPATPYPYPIPIPTSTSTPAPAPSFGSREAASEMSFEASCAICGAPAPAPGTPECPHEAERLAMALQQAQQRWLSSSSNRLEKIRHWVLNSARAQILTNFNQQKALRQSQYSAYITSLPFYSLYVQWSGRPPLAPAALHNLTMQIAAADAKLQAEIDADWRAAVMKYPEVLDHYYGLVEFRVPGVEGEEKRKTKGRSGSGSASADGDGTESPKRKRKDKEKRNSAAPPAVPMPGAFPSSGASYFGGY